MSSFVEHLLSKLTPTQKPMRELNKIDLSFPDHISESARDLIERILVLDPANRLSLDQIRMHPWIIENAHLHQED
jgi:serine/threonine protein kinase